MQAATRLIGLMTVCGLLFAAGTATPALAQSERPRSDTGRRKAEPVTPEKAAEPATVRPIAAGAPRWFVGVGGGLQGGGNLWRTETANGAVVRWLGTPDFSASRFTATLDNNFALGLMAGRHLSDRWSLRLDLASSRLDLAAEALQGQTVKVVRYDRLTMTALGLSAEVRLVDLPSYPYLTGGVLVRIMTAAREDELDQQQLGARLGVGYLQALEPGYSLRLEARLSRAGFEAGSFRPGTAASGEPLQDFRPVDSLNILELTIAVQANL